MERFCIRLEASDPAQGRFRAYRIEAGIDLLGDWVVDVIYGRIGTRGRRIRHVATDEAQACRIVRHCLQRRATAPRRIGVSYQLRELADPGHWFSDAANDYFSRQHST
jgi:predicted DNA-binding WGR domain protein